MSRDKTDEELKARSRDWWSAHSQDYVAPGEYGYGGARDDLDDQAFLDWLTEVDANFMADGYFGQARRSPLFSGLIPTADLAGKRVLEVGCGLGPHTEVLCRAGAEVTAIDLSPVSVAVTRRRLTLKGLAADVQEADAEHLPFDDKSFDFVWSWGVIHHSPDTLACAREITRVMRPGARLGIMLYHRHSAYNWINVTLRYGILRGELLRGSIQDLHNRYTDGKHIGGAPLSKYYTRRDVRETLFPDLVFSNQRAFEQKKVVSRFFPARMRRKIEAAIPDGPYTRLWNRWGFLLFSEARKPALVKRAPQTSQRILN